MTEGSKPSYEELEQRLQIAESALQAIRAGQVDAILGENQQLVVRLAEAEAREAHIKKVLLAIRNVNQLIIREKDPARLIQGACDLLVENRGYHNAWIVLWDQEKPDLTAQAGLDEHFADLIDRLKQGQGNDCVQKAQHVDTIVISEHPLKECLSCPLAEHYQDQGGLTVRLHHNQQEFGVLTVSIPRKLVKAEEEHSLLQEVAKDISFALHNLELEKKQAQVEQVLRENQRLLEEAERLAAVGAWEWDIENDKWRCSENWQHIHGTKQTDLSTPAIISIVHPEDRETIKTAIKAVRKEGGSYDVQHRIIKQDTGETRFIQAYGRMISGKSDHVPTLIGAAQDITEQVQTLNALQQSEEKYRKLVETLNEGIWVIDQEGRTTFVNPKMADMLGYTPEEMIGEPLFTFIAQENIPEAEGLLEKRQQGISEQHEFTFQTKTGDAVHTLVSTSPFFDETGRYAGAQASVTDITRRKATEEALLESERQKELILNSTSEMVTYYSPDLQVIWTNQASAQSVGKTPEELVGSFCYQIWHNSDEPCENCPVLEAKKRKEPWQGEQQTPDGRDWSLRGYPVLDEAGEVIALVEFGQDITEKKKAARALRDSEQRYRTLFETANDAIFIMNKDGFVSCNQEAVRMFGCDKKSDILGQTPWDFSPPTQADGGNSQQQARTFIQNALNGERQRFHWQHLKKDGTPFEAEISLKTIKLQGKNYLQAMVRDITERLQAQEELETYRKELERLVEERTAELRAANQELESFTYSVSHDLRAPLRHIDGFVQLLLERETERLDATSQRYLNNVASASDRMGQLIDDLLQFSRTARLEMERRSFAMKDVVDKVIEDLSLDLETAAITWEVAELPHAHADPNLMRIVWTNLISNAVKFSSQREVPRVEIGHLSHSEAAAECGLAPETCLQTDVFFIRDNGVGFDQQYVDKLFGVFQRLHKREVFKGTGIGLAIVKRIIQRHGGQIWAVGEPNQGATFYFTLEKYPA